ncbi:MAG TPA: cupin [Xanthobacteraceae bacterium]|nr:cupin [Xanthobacteraceae bacterium]
MPGEENFRRPFDRPAGSRTLRGAPAAPVREVEIKTFRFADDGKVPNHPRWPLLLYPQVLRPAGEDAAALFESVFAGNGWGGMWRDGVYPYVHYHSRIHEALGIVRGRARLRFGGESGAEIAVAAGDVAVLPAGTGHQRLEASADFLVVGAYPPEGEYDLCRTDAPADRDRALQTIPQVPKPRSDPLFGAGGPLTRIWE